MSSNLNQVIFLNLFINPSICDLFKIRIFVVQSTSQNAEVIEYQREW